MRNQFTNHKQLFPWCLHITALTFLVSCISPEPFRPHISVEDSELLKSRLEEIESRFELGRIKEAITLSEEALIDHYHSQRLRDRLAELRSIRQVWFTRDLKESQSKLEDGYPRTAFAILKEIDGYGDAEMVERACLKKEEITRAYPAIYIED